MPLALHIWAAWQRDPTVTLMRPSAMKAAFVYQNSLSALGRAGVNNAECVCNTASLNFALQNQIMWRFVANLNAAVG